jgi:hypothetical protein
MAHELTLYDAAYVELAVRRQIPLASRDQSRTVPRTGSVSPCARPMPATMGRVVLSGSPFRQQPDPSRRQFRGNFPDVLRSGGVCVREKWAGLEACHAWSGLGENGGDAKWRVWTSNRASECGHFQH